MKESKRKKSNARDRETVEIIKKVQRHKLFNPSGLKKGIKIIDQHLQVRGNSNTDLLRLKGNLFEILGKDQESAIIYRKILRLVPNHIEALSDLGDVYQNLEEFQKALPYYNHAFRLIKTGTGHTGIYRFDVKGEDFIQTVDGKARCLLALQKPKLAIKCLLNALQLYPYDISLVARFQEAQKQYQELNP